MDTLFIKQLTVSADIGTQPYERQNRQDILLDIDMGVETIKASCSDELEDTVCYSAVRDYMLAFAEKNRFDLVEAFADTLASELLENFNIKSLRLRLTKPCVFEDAQGAGIEIVRKA